MLPQENQTRLERAGRWVTNQACVPQFSRFIGRAYSEQDLKPVVQPVEQNPEEPQVSRKSNTEVTASTGASHNRGQGR
jgi:hypothetical protein